MAVCYLSCYKVSVFWPLVSVLYRKLKKKFFVIFQKTFKGETENVESNFVFYLKHCRKIGHQNECILFLLSLSSCNSLRFQMISEKGNDISVSLTYLTWNSVCVIHLVPMGCLFPYLLVSVVLLLLYNVLKTTFRYSECILF